MTTRLEEPAAAVAENGAVCQDIKVRHVRAFARDAKGRTAGAGFPQPKERQT